MSFFSHIKFYLPVSSASSDGLPVMLFRAWKAIPEHRSRSGTNILCIYSSRHKYISFETTQVHTLSATSTSSETSTTPKPTCARLRRPTGTSCNPSAIGGPRASPRTVQRRVLARTEPHSNSQRAFRRLHTLGAPRDCTRRDVQRSICRPPSHFGTRAQIWANPPRCEADELLQQRRPRRDTPRRNWAPFSCGVASRGSWGVR